MKAIVYTRYGLSDVLEYVDVEKPVPTDNEVLIKLCAVSLNASDWELLTGKPLYSRIYGFRKPKIKILGSDISGRVEEVGRQVKQFKPGDEVFGDIFEHFGGFAEYTCAPAHKLIHKPASMTFAEVAAIPQSACIALQGIRDKGQIKLGQKVLINGAGGGAGSFAIQIAKYFGAEVTAVDNKSKLEMMRAIGADHVIDFTQEDFSRNGLKYDLILDLAAHHSFSDYKRALTFNGKYLMVGGSVALILKLLTLGTLVSLFGRRTMALLTMKPNRDMDFIINLLKTGKVVPVIDRYFPLYKTADAFRYLGEGHAKGKIIVTMEHKNSI